MIYIAGPYSHPDPLVRKQRYEAHASYLESRIKQKLTAYSPIVNFHAFAIKRNLPYSADYWENINYTFLEQCDELHVLEIKGLLESVGTYKEILHWLRIDQGPIHFVRWMDLLKLGAPHG